MELHETIRDVVDRHGRDVLTDPSGFRGLLDDVLDESAATTGEINLLVDAVRFDVLGSLDTMIAGGADPDSAVREAGARLARERGGDDLGSASWAAGVLGYAVGTIGEAVLARYRSQRPAGPPPPGGSPYPGPPVVSPAPFASPFPPPATPPSGGPAGWPGSGPAGHSSDPRPAPAGPPSGPGYPGQGYPAQGGPGQGYPAQGYPAPAYPGPGYPGQGGPGGYAGAAPGTGGPRRRKKGLGLWIALGSVMVLLLGGGILTAVLLSGDGEQKKDDPEPSVDLTAEGVAERYGSLASSLDTELGECTEGETAQGESEVVDCTAGPGTLRLVTYESPEELRAVRRERLDHRSGSLGADQGDTAFYEFDPESAGSESSAVIYWDSTSGPQSAELTGAAGTMLPSLQAVFTNAGPVVEAPTEPTNEAVRDFVEINMDISDCERRITYREGTTEESTCSPTDDITVDVYRYARRADVRQTRQYYRSQWRDADQRNDNDFWRFGEGSKEGSYFSFVRSGYATLYWDWDRPGCNCFAIANGYDTTLAQMDRWWASQ